MYIVTTKQLERIFDSPACRHHYFVAGSRCALGKFFDLLAGEGSAAACMEHQDSLGGYLEVPTRVATLLTQLKEFGIDAQAISKINDAPGDLQINHTRALRLLLQECQEKKLLVIKDYHAEEFTTNFWYWARPEVVE